MKIFNEKKNVLFPHRFSMFYQLSPTLLLAKEFRYVIAYTFLFLRYEAIK